MSRVRVLYDFQAEGANELSTYAGEELTVVDPNQFDGWIQVQNAQGAKGIVPSSYITYNDDDDDIPPPPSSSQPWNNQSQMINNQPPSYVNGAYPYQSNQTNSYDDNWGMPTTGSGYNNKNAINTSINSTNSTAQMRSAPNKSAHHDSEDSDFSENEAPGHLPNNSNAFHANNRNSIGGSQIVGAGAGPSKHKSKDSYGLAVFLLHGAVKNVLDSDRFSSIVLNPQRQSEWKRSSPPYQISIVNYHQDKKYHGVKKFISYDIQTTIFKSSVKRRYNHFDWLQKRLEEKYPNLCVPPLPDKAVAGNFEEEFIAKRKSQLELWLNRMASHPVIGQSEVFIHFLQCDDQSSKWKSGKRKAEKDEYRGAQWFCTLTVPGESVDTSTNIKERVDKFSKATINLDNCVKNVLSALEKISAYHSSSYKKEFLYLGKKFEELGNCLSNEALDAPNNSAVSTALVTSGLTYSQIGNMYGEQAKIDAYPLMEKFYLYRGIIQQMPDIVQFEKNAIQTCEEYSQKPEKLEGRSPMEMVPRRELITHVTFAEINLFNKDKVDDFAQSMRTYLQQQITFYTEITECLKKAYANFEKIPNSHSISANNGQTNASFRK